MLLTFQCLHPPGPADVPTCRRGLLPSWPPPDVFTCRRAHLPTYLAHFGLEEGDRQGTVGNICPVDNLAGFVSGLSSIIISQTCDIAIPDVALPFESAVLRYFYWKAPDPYSVIGGPRLGNLQNQSQKWPPCAGQPSPPLHARATSTPHRCHIEVPVLPLSLGRTSQKSR